MVRNNQRQILTQLLGMLICACLVLKPLLLLGHLLTEDHCLPVDGGACVEKLAHLDPHEHEHLGVHAHEDRCHDDEGAHHSHCELSLEEHLDELMGEPANVRGDTGKRLLPLQLAAWASPIPAIQLPVAWPLVEGGPEHPPGGRGVDAPLRPRGPPVA